ncbi:MAG: M23 family metallopeptidase, partial [Ilumatobacter sp.]
MTTDPTHPDRAVPGPHAARFGRRSLFVGLGLGAAAFAVSRTGDSVGAAAGQLNEPGEALAPAHRVSPPTSSTTSTTSTVPTSTTPPVAGQIRFPIIVGEGDTCYVGRNFGAPRGCCRSHEGLDLMADRGLEVVAVVDGELTKKYVDSGSSSGAGNGWTLTDEAGGVIYKFFHLDSHAEGLEVGDMVTAGQVLGYVGETGTSG